MIFFVITHTCAQIIRELRFWWKNFLCLPVEWCKWHINIISSLNNILFRNEKGLDSRHHFWLLVKKNYKWNWKNLFSKSFEKNLPVNNSILPTITVPFFSRLQKCEEAIPQYNQYGVFSFCLVLFIYNCVVIGYFRWLFLLLLFFFFSYSFVVMDTRNIHPYQHGFSYLCMLSKPQNMIFFCWL